MRAPTMTKREWFLIVPLLSLLLLIPFWEVATMQGVVITNDIATSDMANLHHPERHFLGRELRAGRLPLWLPQIYMGYPVQAEGMVGAFYPPNLLLFGLLPVRIAQNLSVLWPFFVAAFATYALARKLGAGVWPALVAALAYALGGFYIVHVKHVPIVHAACWIPFIWLLIELGLGRDRRFLLAVGVVWAIQWLAGMPQIAYYSVAAGLFYFLGRALQTQRLRATAPLFALALLLSFGLAAVQIWPTAELAGYSERAGGVSFDFATGFHYRLDSLWTFLYPYANGDPGMASYQIEGLFWEDYAYIGLLPLFAALVGGLWLARKSGLARLLLLMAGTAFLLVLGENTPLFRLAFDWLPGMAYFRFPQRLLSVVTLDLALLAALSLTHLQEWLAGRRWPVAGSPRLARLGLSGATLLGVILAGLVVADLYFYHIRQNAIVDAETWYEPPRTAQRIHEDIILAGASPAAGSGRVFSVGAVLRFYEAYRQAGGWEGDLAPYVAQREFLQPSLNVLYDVPAAGGYANLTPGYLTRVWGNEKESGFVQKLFYRSGERLLAQEGFGRLLSLYNVRYLISFLPLEQDGFDLLGVYGPEAYLYENRDVMSRAFAVPTYTLAGDVPAALEHMVSPGFDPAREVVLFAPFPEFAERPDAGGLVSRVDISRDEPLRVSIKAEVNQPAILVLSDLYYPGWEATVDGQPTPIHQANACVRAVPLDPGRHQVEFRFRPASLRNGAIVSGLSALALIIVYKLSRA